ncbi:MAG TPA: glycosyltransferase family 39 protein [Candidatus Angelobacter sp.]
MNGTGNDLSPDTKDYWLLTFVCVVMSCAAFVFYFHRHAILLYGDAVAHTNIARHVFDSRTPGILEFGTVWLPLPHLIDMPFVANNWMWRSGIGASIPSMIAYVVGVLGVFRLVCGFASRRAAWLASLIYALNPNLLYLQATAMTETLYLALFIWAIVHFSEFVRAAQTDDQRAARSLRLSGVMVAAAMLVRYDGWFLAAWLAVALLGTIWRFKLHDGAIRRSAAGFVLLCALTGGLWLAYNHGAYGRATEFAAGPYSARAIAEQMKTSSFPTYPGENSPRTAALYFLKVSRLNVAEGWLDFLLPGIAFVALLTVLYFSRRHLPLALLWTPVIFYVLVIAYGSVPIYLPEWWPHSYYNVRYGLQLLPAIAVFAALGYEFLGKFIPGRAVAAAVLLIVAASYAAVWQKEPICLREAKANGAARMSFDARLAAELQQLPASANIMMYCGAHAGALQDAGIPFRRVLREGNHPAWEQGLSGPAQAADYIVAIEGDEVFYAVRRFPQNLKLIAIVDTPGSGRAMVYRSGR